VKPIWMQTLAWLAAVAAALALAFAAPTESSVLGRLPSVDAIRLDLRPVSFPQDLPSRPTLALVAFAKSQRAEIDSWIHGLRLHQDPSIAWLKVPVLNDPGSPAQRSAAIERLQQRHPREADRARLLPLFTDRDAFVRSAGLSGTEHAGVLVVARDGRVLARVEGHYDEAKAQALLETLMGLAD
jgi:hypothetical protein